MAARGCIFILILTFGTMGANERLPELIVWNVGQGQWATIVDDQACWHLDLGGEFAPWREIIQTCRHTANRASLSHWDTDHISFVGKARSHLPDFCLLNRPLGKASSNKEFMLTKVPNCKNQSP